jgi:hypothetical protein
LAAFKVLELRRLISNTTYLTTSRYRMSSASPIGKPSDHPGGTKRNTGGRHVRAAPDWFTGSIKDWKLEAKTLSPLQAALKVLPPVVAKLRVKVAWPFWSVTRARTTVLSRKVMVPVGDVCRQDG